MQPWKEEQISNFWYPAQTQYKHNGVSIWSSLRFSSDTKKGKFSFDPLCLGLFRTKITWKALERVRPLRFSLRSWSRSCPKVGSMRWSPAKSWSWKAEKDQFWRKVLRKVGLEKQKRISPKMVSFLSVNCSEIGILGWGPVCGGPAPLYQRG